MVLIDLQKAFDIIYHKILLKKYFSVGFSAQSIVWFECYLSNRRVQANIKNEFFYGAYINCGVPQGSISESWFFIFSDIC